jgi:hypothetical protein
VLPVGGNCCLASFWGFPTVRTTASGRRVQGRGSGQGRPRVLPFRSPCPKPAVRITPAEQLTFAYTRIYHVTGAGDIDKAFADAVTWQAQALTTSGLPPFLARREVTQFALRQRWVSAYPAADFVPAGGLMSLAVAGS